MNTTRTFNLTDTEAHRLKSTLEQSDRVDETEVIIGHNGDRGDRAVRFAFEMPTGHRTWSEIHEPAGETK